MTDIKNHLMALAFAAAANQKRARQEGKFKEQALYQRLLHLAQDGLSAIQDFEQTQE